jgi:hypothetical protein
MLLGSMLVMFRKCSSSSTERKFLGLPKFTHDILTLDFKISCSKLSFTYSSITNLASSASLTSSSSSFNFPSHSSSFQFNYSQIIVNLKAGWELANDSEILDIENTGKASQEEFKNIESEDSMETECTFHKRHFHHGAWVKGWC